MKRYGFEVFELEPLEMRPFPDGRHLVLYRDEARNVETIRRSQPHDAEAYPRWNAFWAARRVDRESRTGCGRRRRWRSCSTTSAARTSSRVLELLVTKSFGDLLDEWFESDMLKAALVHSGDVGDPRGVGTAYPSANLAGGSMDVMADVGNTVGIVRGGMGSITAALGRPRRRTGPRSGPRPRWIACSSRAVARWGSDSPTGRWCGRGRRLERRPEADVPRPRRRRRPAGRLPRIGSAALDPRVLPEVPRGDARAARLLALPRARTTTRASSRASGSTRRSPTTSRPGATRRAASRRARR